MSDKQTETAQVEQPPQTAIAVQPPRRVALEAQAAGVLPIIPTNIEEALRYAKGLIAAGIVPEAYKHKDAVWDGDRKVVDKGEVNAELVLAGILKAMEVGVAPQTGLGGLLPLNGRFTVWGDLAAALVQRGGQVANQTSVEVGPSFDPETPLGDWPKEYGFEVRYWRVGQTDPYVGRFTVRDAQRAGLWMNSSKKPWIMYPKRMLFNRARAFVLRDGFADALSGLSIAEEVLDSMPAPEAVSGPRTPSLADDEPVTALPASEPAERAQGEDGGQEGGDLPLEQ